MAEINRSQGTTPSERYLGMLADHSFLNLWSYPNVYRDVVVNGKRAGKELCDLLVVCGPHVLIFSDKTITWKDDADTDVAWCRWYRRAIKKSAAQIRGAERWIEEHPDRIFLDEACTIPLPIKIPPPEERQMHSILVALGAHKACSEHFGGEVGSFMIRPQLVGDDHMDPAAHEYAPFTIGDIDPEGSFIHVMNDITLDVVMRELDTITDLTDYLTAKVAFIRNGNLGLATGEEDLLAYYLTRLVGDQHGFAHPNGGSWQQGELLALGAGGDYERLIQNPQYRRKKAADRVSYLWDRLIEAFTRHMLAGTTISRDGPFEIQKSEVAVRHMALETRLHRRLLGEGVRGVLEVANNQDRMVRTMLPDPQGSDRETAYVFMTLALPKRKLPGGYRQYRSARANMLTTYCLAVMRKYDHLSRVIGIAMEPPPVPGGPQGSSEDIAMLERPEEWTDEDEKNFQEAREHHDILREERINLRHQGVVEYPEEQTN